MPLPLRASAALAFALVGCTREPDSDVDTADDVPVDPVAWAVGTTEGGFGLTIAPVGDQAFFAGIGGTADGTLGGATVASNELFHALLGPDGAATHVTSTGTGSTNGPYAVGVGDRLILARRRGEPLVQEVDADLSPIWGTTVLDDNGGNVVQAIDANDDSVVAALRWTGGDLVEDLPGGGSGLVRFDRSGAVTGHVAWSSATIKDVALAPDGGVYVALLANSAWTVDGTAVVEATSRAPTLVRFDADLAVDWVLAGGAHVGSEPEMDLAALPDGGVAVSAMYAGTLTWGDLTLTSPGQTGDVFTEPSAAVVARVAPDGEVVWHHAVGDGTNVVTGGIDADDEGRVAFGVSVASMVSIGGFTHLGTDVPFTVVVLDACGDALQGADFAWSGWQVPVGWTSEVAFAPGGDVLVSGFQRNVPIDGDTLGTAFAARLVGPAGAGCAAP